MAFRLKGGEPIRPGLRRLAAKQLKDARDQLRGKSRPSDEAIHEARKSLKKARAIVQLIEADAGRHLGDSRKGLRAVNRTLSRLRDADAMLGIFDKLRTRTPQLIGERTFTRLRRRLAAGKRAAVEKAGRRDDWKKVDRQLRALRKSTARWRQAHRGFGALERGMRDAHRRGRKALARARNRQRAEDFHEWRKAMKALWYQLRLLGGRSRRIGRDAEALHRAETLLGDEHNVVVLCGVLTDDPSVCRTAEDLDRVRLAADRYQCEMRKRALHAARRVYAPTSGAYVRSIKREWRGDGRFSRA